MAIKYKEKTFNKIFFILRTILSFLTSCTFQFASDTFRCMQKKIRKKSENNVGETKTSFMRKGNRGIGEWKSNPINEFM